MEKTVENNLLQTLNIERLVEFDSHIGDVFQNVFYTLSNNTAMKIEKMGIVSHFLRSWKDTVGASSISKTLPSIITGSIVEGACLSRLYHPSHEQSLELEADIMYIVGVIDEQTANQCFQDEPKTGFLKVKYSPSITMFTSENQMKIENAVEITPDGCKYLNGKELKIMHKNLQVNEQRLRIDNGSPCIITVNQKISGPSSEIVFKIVPIHHQHQIENIASFLKDITQLFEGKCESFYQEFTHAQELCTILENVLKAVKEIESDRIFDKEHDDKNLPLLSCEAEDIISQVIEKFNSLDTSKLETDFKEMHSLLEGIILLCSGNEDSHAKARLDVFNIKSLDLTAMAKETLQTNPMVQEVKGQGKTLNEAVKVLEMIDISLVKAHSNLPNILQEYRENIVKDVANLVKSIEDRSKEECYHQNIDSISFDNVSCFYCPFWPKIAEEWVHRKRQWPSTEQIQQISDAGTFIVAKQSEEGQHHALEWRWSFSTAEISLAKLRTSTMKYCYFIFKTMFYKYFKNFPGVVKSLPSYFAKTCMLYVSEQQKEYWWDENGVVGSLLHLFKFLKKSLEEKMLPHYFIHHLNLLQDIDISLINQALNMVNQILQDPSNYLTLEESRMEIFNRIENEVNSLLSTGVESEERKTPTGYYKHFTSLRQKCAEVTSNLHRSAFLGEYYRLRFQQVHLQKLIETQDKMLQKNRGKGPDYDLIEEYFVNNKMVLQKLDQEIPTMRRSISEALIAICHLLERYCKSCDVCSGKIPCGSKYFEGLVNDCKNTVCGTCYDLNHKPSTLASDKNDIKTNDRSELNNSNSMKAESSQRLVDEAEQENGERVAGNLHDYKEMDECSIYCFTQFTHERLDQLNEGSTQCFNEVFEAQKLLTTLITEIGQSTREHCSLLSYQGALMNQELNKLFQKLAENIEQEVKEEIKQEIGHEGDPSNKIEKHASSYQEAIDLIKKLTNTVEKRNLIEKIVFRE